jgi:hypothetical protein
MGKKILDEYKKIYLDDYNQNFQGVFFNPEGGGDDRLNTALSNIYRDLIILDDHLVNTGYAIDNLMTDTIERLDEVRRKIILEKERYQDIQMLCNKYTDFDNIQTLETLKFNGSYSEDNGVIYAPVKKEAKVALKILDVNGNGYEGNKYVYNNFEYQKDIYDTSIRNNITDKKISTYYEYSRITVPNNCEEHVTYFNKDNTKAKCTISFEAEEPVDMININTEDMGITITDIQYSNDGIKYLNLKLKNKISINNKLDSYDNYGYIYGSGIISIPLAKYFKITLEADKDTEDIIAYEKTIVEGDKYSLETKGEDSLNYILNKEPATYTTTYTVKGAKRSAIKINDISAYKKVYVNNSQIITDKLPIDTAYAISLFANVYVPEGIEDSSIKFKLTINEQDYDVVPINSDMNGTKIIRFSGGKSNTTYTKLINETIKSARLSITISCKSNCTPFVNNIKILIGGAV